MIAGRLLAPPPGWRRDADVVVIGSGVAGVTTVLAIRRALPAARILLVTKSVLDDGSTRWAQGGVAAALDPADSPDEHLTDTLTAGAGISDEQAVRALVTDGPGAVRRLIALGAEFDREPAGPLSLTREGGHLRRRIAHAGGDATGAEVSRALLAALAEAGSDAELEVIEDALAIDLLRTADGRAAGITLHVLGEGQQDGVGAVHARAVVLATGGFGQVYSATTNPRVSTGDGLALALRAGAEAADLEFIQFHPTVLWLGPQSHGRQPLISEAVRGEGAYLVDEAGHRFMIGQHPLADLAPRDVVAKAIMRVLIAEHTDHVYLDGRHLGAEVWQHRFPTILVSCREHGIDPVTELIPVVPAAHYASGGIRTDLRGRTSVPGLYACGETACTGVHGANRLASNSLLEGLVFAERIAADLAAGLPPATAPAPDGTAARLLDPAIVWPLQQLMSAQAGVLRSGGGLAAARAGLAALGQQECDKPGADAWQATNLHLVASAIVTAALAREETRGSHWREDFPDPRETWRGHLIVSLQPAGLGTVFQPARAAGPESAGTDPVTPIPAVIAGRLRAAGLDPDHVAAVARAALAEDLAGGTDVTTTATVPAGARGRADLVARSPGVVAGLPVAELVFWLVSPADPVTAVARADDGDRVTAGSAVLTVSGSVRSILTAERTALNLLSHLSGIATLTRQFADAVAGTGARIRDTRKTLPGLRALQKYAVRCGGGINHRMSLSDAALVKDNHVAAAGSVGAAFRAARALAPGLPVEVECDTLSQVEEALAAGADLILLDNFSSADMAEAVRLASGRALVEASGGLTLAGARVVAATGVNYLAVGALTHSAPSLDIGLDLTEAR